MDRLLRPERLDADPSSPTAAQEWKHWIRTFQTFLAALKQEGLDKLGLLTNFVSPKVFECISECGNYDDALSILQALYVKPTNEVFARHSLATRRQQPGESLDEYFRCLKVLSKECNFKAVTATQHCEEYIRDAFISGLLSPLIRQRLLLTWPLCSIRHERWILPRETVSPIAVLPLPLPVYSVPLLILTVTMTLDPFQW